MIARGIKEPLRSTPLLQPQVEPLLVAGETQSLLYLFSQSLYLSVTLSASTQHERAERDLTAATEI